MRAPVSAFSSPVNGEGELLSFIFPKSISRGCQYSVHDIEAIGGKAFEVSHPEGIDVVMIRGDNCNVVETAQLSSDFEWTWVRFPAADALPQEFVLLNGQSLKLSGSEFLQWKECIQYSAGHASGETFRVDTPDGNFDFRLPITDRGSNVGDLSQRSRS